MSGNSFPSRYKNEKPTFFSCFLVLLDSNPWYLSIDVHSEYVLRLSLFKRTRQNRFTQRPRMEGAAEEICYQYYLWCTVMELQTSLKRFFHGTAQSIVPLRPIVPRMVFRVLSRSKRPPANPLTKLATDEKEMRS